MNEYNNVLEIENRIEKLKNQAQSWSKIGGSGSIIAEDTYSEIKDLEVRKNDLINGTDNYKKLVIDREIKNLKSYRKTLSLLRKVKSNKQSYQKNKTR